MPDIDSLQIQISADAASAAAGLEKLSASLGRIKSAINGIDTSGFQQLASRINQLSTSIQNFSARTKTADFTRIATGLNRLSNVNVQGVSDASRAISTLTANLNGIGTIAFDSQGIANISNSIAQLGRKTVTQASENIPKLTAALQDLKNGLSNFSINNANFDSLSQLTSSITKLGGKSATTAASGNIQKLSVALKDMMKTLSTAPTVSKNIIQMTQALAQLASAGGRAGTAATGLTRSFDSLPTATSKAKSGFGGLASAIGKFYATYWLLIRGLNQFGNAIDISSKLTEVQNVVDVSFGSMADKMNEFADSALQLYGMSELAAKQIGSRFQAMGVSMGFAQEDMADMSIRLTQLAGDLASFYNITQNEAATKLQSIFTGESEPLRSLGIDLAQTSVEAWALSQGIDANMRSMTNAEKTMLRYQYVLASTGQATGDFQRTSNSWANSLRLLTGSFEQLGSIVGGVLINAFKPFIQALNSVMGSVIQFAQVVSDALGAIFGWEYQVGGGVANDMAGAASAAEDLESATGGAADNAKKLKSYTLGIDELNILEPDTSDSGGGGGGGGGASGGASAGDGGQWVQTETLWEKYTSSIDTLYELGSYISDVLTDAMNDIDWDDVYETARNFGSGLADFLNGLIKPSLFDALGTTIAGALNTALHFLDSFGEEFEWENFGNSVATGINNFFDEFDFELLASAINNWVLGLLDFIITVIQKTDWAKIGTEIGTFLAELEWFEALKKVAEAIGSALTAVFELVGGMFSVAPIETTIVAGLIAISTAPKVTAAINSLSSIGTSIQGVINTIATSPYLNLAPIAVGITGLALAFDALEKKYLSDVASDIRGWLEGLGVTEITDNMSKTAQNLQDIADSMEEVQTQLNSDNSNLDWLVDEYLRLADQTELTAAQQLLLKDYAGQLVGIVPELSSVINTQTGEFTGNKDELYKLIDAHKQYAAAIAYQDLIAQYNKELAQAEIELEANAKKYQDCADRLSALNYVMENSERGSHQQNEALKILGDTWGVQIDTWEEANEYAGAMQEGMDRCTEAENNLSAAAENANSKLDIANQKYQDVAGTLSDFGGAAEEAGNKASEIPTKINESIAETPVDLSPIKTQIEENGDDISQAGQELGKQCLEGYNQGIEENKSTTEEKTKSWVDSLLSWIKEAFGIHSPSTKFKEIAQNCISGYNNGITENGATSQEPISTWVSNILDWFGGSGDDKINKKTFEGFADTAITKFNSWINNNFSSTSIPINSWVSGILTWFGGEGENRVNGSVFGGFANNIITGFNTWIEENFGSTETPISSWVSGIMDWFSGDEESGKVNTTTFGEFASNIISGFSDKVGAEYTNSQGEIETWSSSILEWFWGDANQSKESGLASKFFDFGSWIMEGLERGLRSMWNTVKDLISDIADSINDLMEKEEEIGSPSKRFYRYGKWMMEGLANGLTFGSDEVLNVTSSAATRLATNFSPTNITLPSLRIPEVNTPQLEYAYAASYSPQFSGGVVVGDTIGDIIETIIDTKLAPLIQSSSDSRDELLEEIASKDTSIYMDGRRVNQMLDKQRARSGHVLRKQY